MCVWGGVNGVWGRMKAEQAGLILCEECLYDWLCTARQMAEGEGTMG